MSINIFRLLIRKEGEKFRTCQNRAVRKPERLNSKLYPRKNPRMIRMDTDVQASELIKKYMKRANHPKGWDAKLGV